jgi:hypothetical protein
MMNGQPIPVRRGAPLLFLFLFLLALAPACVGDTGGAALDFPVAAAGPAAAIAGQPLLCADDPAWTVAVTAASLHVGAVYLDQSQPVSGAQATGCILTGTYVAQEIAPLDVDLLSPAPQTFPAPGHGITTPPALIGEVWLTRGAIDAVPSSVPELPILSVVGTATQTSTGALFPFTGTVTLEENYETSSSTAGGNPICKKRIVSPIPAAVDLAPTGGLLLRIDPCRLFTATNFSALPAGPTPGTYQFSDDPTAADYAPTGANLYGNLHSSGPYTFSWSADL